MKIPLETGIEDSRKMLSGSHFATGCYQHNIGFRAGTMIFFRRFRWRVFVVQGGAGGTRNALFMGRNRTLNRRKLTIVGTRVLTIAVCQSPVRGRRTAFAGKRAPTGIRVQVR
jgi:hypothetical protein